jgi:hypothetical protein
LSTGEPQSIGQRLCSTVVTLKAIAILFLSAQTLQFILLHSKYIEIIFLRSGRSKFLVNYFGSSNVHAMMASYLFTK